MVAHRTGADRTEPEQEELPRLRLGFEPGLGDWAILALGFVLILAAVAYWVVGLCP